MLFRRQTQCRLKYILILFASVNFCYTRSIETTFLVSNIEIIPNLVIINSTSITDFICINHQSDDSQLEANLSKLIPSNQIKISTNLLNKTAIHIQLESNNYVGIFHLLCYSKGEQSKGNRADVIVKAAPGVLQLVERCRVYDRQYIKCVIRAPTIATAIQNAYPYTFEFDEINHSYDHTAYIKRFEFLKNESTNEYLTFKWRPTVEGEFPNEVRMNMTAILPYFEPSSYYFYMTPVFRIKPKFILNAASSEIQVNLTSTSPSVFCEKSIVPQLTSNINQTWTVIESERNNILVNNLLSNTIYRVCIKCRQVLSDPDGLEECQEIKTLSRINFFIIILIIFILTLILIVIIAFSIAFWYKKRKHKYIPVVIKQEITKNRTTLNRYELDATPNTGSINSIHSNDGPSAPVLSTNDTDDDNPIVDGQNPYISIASLGDFIDACFPKRLEPSKN